jgi:ribosomal protein L37AE/L43A
MTGAVLDRPASLFADRAPGTLAGGRVTLEQRLNAALREACTNDSTECPVCHARMAVTAAAAAEAACESCGSRLS